MPIKVKRKLKRQEWKPGGHPWKMHTPGLFKSNTEAIKAWKAEGITKRLIKSMHKDPRGARVKSA